MNCLHNEQTLRQSEYTHLNFKNKDTSTVLLSCYSAVQPPFDINFPWLLSFIKIPVFRSPWGNGFTPDAFICCTENINHFIIIYYTY